MLEASLHTKMKNQIDGVLSPYDAVLKIIPRNCHPWSVFLREYLKGKKTVSIMKNLLLMQPFLLDNHSENC